MRLPKWTGSYKTGVTGALISVLWEAFWLVGPPVGVDPASRSSYLWWGAVALVVAVVQALTILIRENVSLKAAFDAKFEIVFLPADDEDASQPYLHVREWNKPSGAWQPAAPFRHRVYRVGIRNLGTAIVPSVSLVLADYTPRGQHNISVGHRLAVMNSDPPVEARDLHPTSSGEPSLFFDVAYEEGYESNPPEYFCFKYASETTLQWVKHDLHHTTDYFVVRLRAEGGGYSCEREFKIGKEFVSDDWGSRHSPLRMLPL